MIYYILKIYTTTEINIFKTNNPITIEIRDLIANLSLRLIKTKIKFKISMYNRLRFEFGFTK